MNTVQIVLTTGVFDVIHPGHISLLAEIRRSFPHCRLVVGVNGDRRAAELKDFVLFTAEERAEIVGALRWVDGILIFEEDNPDELIRGLRPDVFVKGRDWSVGNLPEAPACAEVGARIVFMGDYTYSSSALKRKLIDAVG